MTQLDDDRKRDPARLYWAVRLWYIWGINPSECGAHQIYTEGDTAMDVVERFAKAYKVDLAKVFRIECDLHERQ